MSEPVPYFGTRKAHQANGILTDQHFRVDGAGLPRPSQRSQRPRRCADQITHALHVADGVIGSRAIQQALQFCDHLPLILRAPAPWWAWVTATDTASAASAPAVLTPGGKP